MMFTLVIFFLFCLVQNSYSTTSCVEFNGTTLFCSRKACENNCCLLNSHEKCTWNLASFVDPLPIPPIIREKSLKMTASLFLRHSFHRDLPEEPKVFAFNQNYPSPVIVTTKDRPISVTWINDLPESHLLRVDEKLDGPNVFGNETRMVIHVHGLKVLSKYDGMPEAHYGRGMKATYQYYSESHEPSQTSWYHDHTMGITRLNVVSGLAGMFIIGQTLDEINEFDIPLMIGDVSFDARGQVYFPEKLVHVVLGDHITVNGKIAPWKQVKRGHVYRLRFVNGCVSRPLNISFTKPVKLIGGDRGLFEASFDVSNIVIHPGERAECRIDFEEEEEVVLVESISSLPVLKFVVTGEKTRQIAQKVETDILPQRTKGEIVRKRHFTFRRVMLNMHHSENRAEQHMHWWSLNGTKDFYTVTEFVRRGSLEEWTFLNPTDMNHPIHIHNAHFRVVCRCNVDEECVEGNGVRREEFGEKDTVSVESMKKVRVEMDFRLSKIGRYVYHCHDLTHEDFSMMKNFLVVNQNDLSCDNDGVCECFEDCVTCPNDCLIRRGNVCGNGICEMGDGENCFNCESDCPRNGKKCCGLTANCSDALCKRCRQREAIYTCGGDLICEGEENEWNTPIDCRQDMQCDQSKKIESILGPPIYAFNYSLSFRGFSDDGMLSNILVFGLCASGVILVFLVVYILERFCFFKTTQ